MRSELLLRIFPALAFLIVSAGGFLLFVLLHATLPSELSQALHEIRSEFLPLIVLAFLLPAAGCAWLCYHLISSRILPVGRLADASTLLLKGNGDTEMEKTGVEELDRLRNGLLQAAEALRTGKEQLGRELENASLRLRSERDMLAAIINQLRQGVVVTNKDAHVLLYNHAADEMLSFPDKKPPVYLGLGRAVTSLLDDASAGWAMTESTRTKTGEPVPFVTESPAGRLLSVKVLPASESDNQSSGFIFFLNDITESRSREGQSMRFADSGLRRIRDSIAGIYAAADNLKSYPDAEEAVRSRFHELILTESGRVNEVIKAYESEEQHSASGEGQIPLVDTKTLTRLTAEMCREAEIIIGAEEPDDALHVLADTFTFPVSLAFLAVCIRKETGREPALSSGKHERFVRLMWNWQGEDIREEKVKSWLNMKPGAGKLRIPHTLDEVFARHRANWWIREENGTYSFSVILPEEQPPKEKKTNLRRTDFDIGLFRTKAGGPELEMELESINATVFDTETTGLNPSEGDKLISIGAVRIVNGRLIEQETFDELINPGRTVPEASTKIHGITAEMLEGKPSSDKVIQDFDAFCGKSVLIAHNAAFDMRFLELEHPDGAAALDRPVLDTLLLSTVLHSRLEGHSVDVLAKRFGAETGKRHDALGDALTTARVFMKMIPLLKDAGIDTVGKALNASRESLYAKLRY